MQKRLAVIAHSVLAFSAVSGIAVADVELDPVFTDHMVLQRDLPVPIWGTAGPGEKLTVSFAGQNLDTTADDQGRGANKGTHLFVLVRQSVMVG